MNTRLTHVRANVSDLKRAVAWYTEVLGFRVEATWPPENPDYAHFASDEGATFAVAVATPAPTPWGSRKFTIRDPDGNELSFVEG